MTEDFNEQQRDDVRPSSRNSPSDRHGEERPPRPARPRLNRETVDRAWESGARRDHADYHPRSNNNGQAPRNNWQRNQYSDRPSAQNGRRPYSNQQDNYRRPERPVNGNYNPRPQSFGPPANRRFDDKRFDDRRSYPPRQGGYSPRPGSGFRNNEQHRDQQPQFPDRNQGRGYQRRDFDHGNNSPRPFERGNNSPRPFERGNRFQQPDAQNPRWRSRPTAQNENDSRRQDDPNRRERFEGDYERFETPETPRHLVNKTHQNSSRKGSDERHGTRSSDGHVLKGPRPAQRKGAQIRTEIAHDAEALIEQVEAATPVKDAAPTVNDKPKAPRKPRIHTEDTATPGKKSKAKQGTPKPPSTGPKPSKRGFKWPTS